MRDGRKHDLWRAGSLSAFWAIHVYNFSFCAFCLSPNPGKKNQSDFCCSLFRDQLARASLFSFRCTATLCPTLSLTLHRSVPWQLPKAFSFLPIQVIWLYNRSHFTSCIIRPHLLKWNALVSLSLFSYYILASKILVRYSALNSKCCCDEFVAILRPRIFLKGICVFLIHKKTFFCLMNLPNHSALL